MDIQRGNSKMTLLSKPSIFLLLLTLVLAHDEGLLDLSRSQFPDSFLFGAATSAYQIEGAYLEDGKGLGNWDVFCGTKGNIADGRNADVADDDYHRYLEDIEIMHSIGVGGYRFSISWARILPKGRFGEANQAGILFYNDLIDNLLLKGVLPFVTIHHFDYPQELEDIYGAWLSPQMQEDFVYFAETCFKNFGDRVKYWATINEPNVLAEMAYERGTFPPSRCSPPFGNCSAGNSDVEPLIAAHNMMLAHAKAVKLYRYQFQGIQGGSIGLVVNAPMYEPFTDDEHDKSAAERLMSFLLAWVLDPVVFGEYPPEMRQYHGSELPEFTAEETMLLKDSVDFIGLNHYYTLYAKDCIYSSCVCDPLDTSCIAGGDRAIRGFATSISDRNGIPIGEPTGNSRFFVVPRGLEEVVNYVKSRYNNKPMYITENGYSSPKKTDQINGIHNDVKRIEFHKSYLSHLARAIRNGADVRGYFIWSLMDSFEWTFGYEVKYGLYYVDPRTLERIPKSSSNWYKNFLSNTIARSSNNTILMKNDAMDFGSEVSSTSSVDKTK